MTARWAKNLSSPEAARAQACMASVKCRVVHIFVEGSRRFYEIERLYKDIVPASWA
jgi:ribosomal silencing factor RsfS